MIYFSKNKGFSLVELIIYLAVFSVLISSLFVFINNITVFQNNNQAKIEVNSQGSRIVNIINQTIRNGSLVETPASNILIVDQMIFSEDNGIIYLTEQSNPGQPLNNNKVIINNLSFANLNQENSLDIIQTRFNLTSADNNFTNQFYGTASLRK